MLTSESHCSRRRYDPEQDSDTNSTWRRKEEGGGREAQPMHISCSAQHQLLSQFACGMCPPVLTQVTENPLIFFSHLRPFLLVAAAS